MKIVVTGGAGFIGSHIADAYLAKGHQVIIIDNLSKGSRRNVPKKAKFYKADIRAMPAIERVMKRERPHILNHHAGIAEISASMRDPLPTFGVNTAGMAAVLVAFGRYGAPGRKRVIFASSGSVYGDVKRGFAQEDMVPVPVSAYSLSKIHGEELLKLYGPLYGFDYVIFRYPNVYGPRQNPKSEAGVIAIFHELMRAGQRPVMFGDGTKIRDYTYVGDIVAANLKALSRGTNQTLNLARMIETKDVEIFNELKKILAFKKPLIFKPFRRGEALRTALDARKAYRVLGWRPQVALREGIGKFHVSLV
jgi:UDP-glucose 4-epimerase